ncbi:uncharacterized protein [Watersipora subatra]|uniref:uncharacterized protein n=1 Tax=Watersipora subatra TaxID=2589382 RepID=UPI00355B1B43
MSKRKIAYARKNVIDPEEEGEELPFEPRNITIHTDYWFDRDYDLHDKLLGRGKFGEVRRCNEKSSGLVLAAKIVTARREKEKEDVRKEIKIMSQLRHPKILQIYDAFESAKQMCIITELVNGGELFDRVVDEDFDLTERVAILFMRQIIDGIAFIHSQNILHLDMKPENVICVAKTGTRIKIIDFGLATRYDSFSSTKVMAGTVDFMAPEVCNYEDVTPSTDMWSVGVICYVLVSGLSPFCGDDDADTICNILRIDFDFAAEEFDEVTAGCKDFIKKLLVKDPRKRMTALECMKHSWLNKITRSQTNKHLSKKHHIKFFVKRKWKKVIQAVIAINRFARIAQERKAASTTPCFLPEPEVAEIPGWRVRMDERIAQGKAKAELINNKNTLQTCNNPGGLPLVGTTSSLSCSSGYDSSGSTKSSATTDDVALLIGCNVEEQAYDDDDTNSGSVQRLESVETLVNDDVSELNMKGEMDMIHTDRRKHLEANSKSASDVQACLKKVSQSENESSTEEDSEEDELYNYYTDAGVDECNSSHLLASKSPTCLDHNINGHEAQELEEPSVQADTEDRYKVIHQENEDSSASVLQDPENSESSNFPSRLECRASLLENLVEVPDDVSVKNVRSRQNSEKNSGNINELAQRIPSPCTTKVDHTSRSETGRYNRSRKSSALAIGSPKASNFSPQSSRGDSTPSGRYSRSSRNNSREPSIDQDLDDSTPIGRHRYWSPSPVRELELQRRLRLSALYDENYARPSASSDDIIERVIPIEVEQSPPLSKSRFQPASRQPSASSTQSDGFSIPFGTTLSQKSRSQRHSSGTVNYDDFCPTTFGLRESPNRDPSLKLWNTRESPSRSGLERRQARIAAIMGDSTESLDSIGRRRPPQTNITNNRSYSGSNTENRQARIAAIVNSSNSDNQRECPGLPNSRPSSRTNSDEDRHRRIAAILSKTENS